MDTLSATKGLQFVEKKARDWAAYVQNHWGLLPSVFDGRDVTQQAHANLVAELGSDYDRQIGEALADEGFSSSPIGLTVRRCIWKAVGAFASRSARRKARHTSLGEQASHLVDPHSAGASRLIEDSIDLVNALDNLSNDERRTWRMMRHDGLTVREIASKAGWSRAKAGRLRTSVVEKLKKVLRE